jgi:hypothetical protein
VFVFSLVSVCGSFLCVRLLHQMHSAWWQVIAFVFPLVSVCDNLLNVLVCCIRCTLLDGRLSCLFVAWVSVELSTSVRKEQCVLCAAIWCPSPVVLQMLGYACLCTYSVRSFRKS